MARGRYVESDNVVEREQEQMREANETSSLLQSTGQEESWLLLGQGGKWMDSE